MLRLSIFDEQQVRKYIYHVFAKITWFLTRVFKQVTFIHVVFYRENLKQHIPVHLTAAICQEAGIDRKSRRCPKCQQAWTT